MLRTVSNGQGIHQYIPPNLRRMFYKNPSAVHATHNGKDPYGFFTNGLVLYLPLWALKGDAFKSVDAYEHTCTVYGALWRPYGRIFDNDDEIDCGDNTALDLNHMTLIVWVNFDALGRYDGLIARTDNANALDNFQFLKDPGNKLSFYIFVSNLMKSTTHHTSVSAATWYHCAATYNKVTMETYLNTVVGTSPASQTGDVDNDNVSLRLGNRANNELPLLGKMGEAWVYNRAFSPAEILHNYEVTKWRYQ